MHIVYVNKELGGSTLTEIVGVRFKRVGKIYYFAPESFDIKKGTYVVVETARGLELGDVVIDRKMVADEEIVQPLKGILRIATNEDLKKVAAPPLL